MTLAPETWSGLLEDERIQTLFRPFIGFFDLEPGVPDELPAKVDARLDEDAALIPRLILVLRKLARIRQADAAASWPAHRTKVGRNEPRPCGRPQHAAGAHLAVTAAATSIGRGGGSGLVGG